MNRKRFLSRSIIAPAAMIAVPQWLIARNSNTADIANPIPPEKVKEFVIAGHNDLEKVKSLLIEFPNLLFASWDWGNGDFETALEGAGHMGRKDIAQHLIGTGARPNIFVLTMLGKTTEVKAILESFPGLLNSKGPHGLTLLHHAQKGGDDAKELLSYMQAKGLAETQYKIKD